MTRYLTILILLCSFASVALAQKATLRGQVTDAEDGEPLIGATVSVEGQGVVTDFDGRYEINLEQGLYTLTVSYVSYAAQEISLNLTGDQTLDVQLKSDNILEEVVVTADIAIERETPVAFTNIPTVKLEEELAAQDIPMILNSTPGAYATQSGGGDGDARITLRGFNQRNIAVMLDGIPVNDMENGWVFWSNWFGLDLVTQTMQVQRGLGASKISVPSIGGTVNILTKGIDAKRSLRFKQEVGNDGFFRSTLGLTSGRLQSGWGISVAGSYKQGNGWVDGNFTKGYFYYLRVDKQLGDHLLSLSGFGAPQEHGQRPFTAEIGLIDVDYALEVGVPSSAIIDLLVKDKGRRYSEHWGYQDGKVVNTRKNFYHKPQFSLRHSWQTTERLFWSNVAYLSIGSGGGTAPDGASFPFDENDQRDFAAAVEANQPSFFNPEGRSNIILRSSNNDHFWYGLLSTLQFTINDRWTLSGGIDGRYYRGDHYRTVYDLLGGAGFTSEGNFRIDERNSLLQEGDKFSYDNSGFVRWGGAFGLLEYKQDRWSAFINASGAVSQYKIEDYMKPKEIQLPDTTLFVGYGDTLTHGDQTYHLNSPEAKDQVIDWVTIPTYTLKTGAAYRIDESHAIFVNTGYLSKAQRFNNVINSNRFDSTVIVFQDYDNEKIIAFEAGYNYKSPKFAMNLNGYYTIWENKPLDRPPTVPEDPSDPDSDRVPINVPGIDALHKGIELDFAYKPFKQLTIEGLASIGDWIWNSGETAMIFLPGGIYEFQFDAKGVHVGDAAQIQYGGLVRYEPLRDLYFKLNVTHFAKNFANFQPEDLRGEDGGRESWELPAYTVFNFHAGYFFKVKDIGCSIRANVLNLLDDTFITDARSNDDFNTPSFSDFDAKSSSVHFGQGRRYTVSLQLSF